MPTSSDLTPYEEFSFHENNAIDISETEKALVTFLILQGVYSGILTLLFGLYLAYDTQLIMGGREFELEPEEYIFGAMQLYVDVVFMFMAIAGIARAAS